MILTLDLGNTNLYLGVYQGEKLIATYRTYSDKMKSSDGYVEIFQNFLKNENLNEKDFKGAILSSVIPSLSRTIVFAVEKTLHIPCMQVSQKIKSGIPIKIDRPSELGADLVSDTVGGINKYGNSLLIVDMGTATKYLVVDKDGAFEGCIITPGIKTSFSALINHTAQLMEIEFETPRNIIGKNSKDSLNSGAIYGTVAQIVELRRMIEKDLGYKLIPILTGGNAILLKDHLEDFIYDDRLILDGLLAIYKKNKRD